jgi:hypothetical protein
MTNSRENLRNSNDDWQENTEGTRIEPASVPQEVAGLIPKNPRTEIRNWIERKRVNK